MVGELYQVVLIDWLLLAINLFGNKRNLFLDLLWVFLVKIVLLSLRKSVLIGGFHQQVGHIFSLVKAVLLNPFIYLLFSVSNLLKLVDFLVDLVNQLV